MIGTTLSHYRIESELGRGGMGIVYKATDTKLDRTVAIKVLPSAALASEDDRERFYREAKSAAQLHHPNIASVFEIDEAVPSDAPHGTEPSPFIAMEYISGGTVQDLIKDTLLPLADAVKITTQVAEALKAAHAKDIVHRDIKSANVMITEDGVAKVLDFGLAKTNQSTMLTRMGSTLGTVAYMSPEQARGQEVDGRTDLYSLGTMFYELVSGRLPFAGDYEQAVVYSILNEPPEPLTSIRTGVPMQLEWIINKLLTKDAEYRYQSANDLLVDLKTVDLSGSGHSRRSMPAMSAAQMSAAPRAGQKLPVWVYGAIVGALVLGAAAAWFVKPDPPDVRHPPVATTYANSAETRITGMLGNSMVISSDGSLIASASPEGILLRRSDDLDSPRVIPNSEGAFDLAFSPEGDWISFALGNDDLMKINVAGGAPRLVGALNGPVRGSDWAEDGYIYMGLRHLGLGRIPSAGGQIEMLIDPETVDIVGDIWGNALALPGGRYIVYTLNPSGSTWSTAEIHVFDLQKRDSRILLTGGTDPQYLPTGHLVYYSANTLFAVKMNLGTAELEGDVFPVAEQVFASRGGNSANYPFAISDNGTLVKLRGTNEQAESGGSLQWMGADGSVETLSPDPRPYRMLNISPDGSLILYSSWDAQSDGIFLMNAVLGTVQRLRDGMAPVWAPDGDRFVFSEFNQNALLMSSLSNPESADTLYVHDSEVEPTDWSADGSTILFNVGDNIATNDIYWLDVESRRATPYQQIAGDVDFGVLHPDGEWIAYEQGNFGEASIVVQRFPDGGDRFVAYEGGAKVIWGNDGSTLYTKNNDDFLAEVEVDLEQQRVVTSRPVSPVSSVALSQFDVHPVDGRIIWASASGSRTDEDINNLLPPIDVIVNWFSTFPDDE